MLPAQNASTHATGDNGPMGGYRVEGGWSEPQIIFLTHVSYLVEI